MTHWTEDYAFRSGKYRHEYEFLLGKELKTVRGLWALGLYNGTNSWAFEPMKRFAFQYEGSDPPSHPMMAYYQDMIGFPNGLPLRNRRTSPDLTEPYALDQLCQSGKYTLNGSEILNGFVCDILERPGQDKLWLARNLGWAIIRRDWNWSVNGPLKRRFVHRDHREVSPGAWIPHLAMMELYSYPSNQPTQLVGVLTAKVELAEADIPDAWFEPDFPKGSEIYDLETGRKWFVGQELLSLDQAVVRASRVGPAFRPKPWWQRYQTWTWTSSIVVIVFVGIYTRWRVGGGT